MNMFPVIPAMVVLYATAEAILKFAKPSPDAPPTTGYSWERSSAGPETTDVSQFSVLVGFAFSQLQIEQFFAAANSIYAGVSNSGFDYWNSCFANEVTETTMYATLQKLLKDFTTMVAVFPYFWKFCAVGFRRVEYFVFLKFFGQSGLEGLAIKLFVRLTMFFLGLFESILCLLRE